MVISYFETLMIVVGVCLGLRTITDVGQIGAPLRAFVAANLPSWIGKPLLLCITCMSSFWGIVVFFSIYYKGFVFNYRSITFLISICLISSFLNTVLWNIKELIIDMRNALQK